MNELMNENTVMENAKQIVMNEENEKFTRREWQEKSVKKIDRCLLSDRHEIIPVNACVGSGKTYLAPYAFGKAITMNRESKTISMFVSPRVKLCKQQKDEIEKTLSREFGLVNGKDYELIRVDCESDDFNKNNNEFHTNHAIFVVCDKSLFGNNENKKSESDKKQSYMVFNKWIHRFRVWTMEGRKMCVINYDESHNYSNSQDKMFGREFHK